jgi:hypothetical protein
MHRPIWEKVAKTISKVYLVDASLVFNASLFHRLKADDQGVQGGGAER